MADSASELESDTSSIDGGPVSKTSANYQIEQLKKRVESLQQENRVLKVELETYKLKCKQLAEEKQELKRASVNIVRFVFVLFNLISALIPICKLVDGCKLCIDER